MRSARRSPRTRALAAALVGALGGLLSCAAGPSPGGLGGGGVGALRDDDLLVLGRFSDVLGVAASRRYLFVAGSQGLAVYDTQFDRWLTPRPGAQAASRFQRIAMAADPVSDAVWMGGMGEVVYYQPSTDYTVRVAVAGMVDAIAFDRRDPGRGALVRAGGGWQQVSTVGGVSGVMSFPNGADLIVAPDLAEVYRRFPALRDLQGNITRDEQLREWPVTSGTIAPDRSEVFLGTRGNGVYRVDPAFSRGRQLPYGLLSEGAGAVARAADGIWVAPLGLSAELRPRGGLTFVSDDLQDWRWIEQDRGPDALTNARAFDIAVRGSIAWIATDRGVARVDTRAARPQVVLWSLLTGLPSDLALAVEPREGGAWVGTSRGLAWVSDTGRRVAPVATRVGETVATGVAVHALHATGDTLWMGTDAGLLLLPPGERATPVRSTLQQQDARLAGRIRAIASSDSVVVLGLDFGDVVRVNRRTGQVMPRLAPDVRTVGRVVALAIDAQSLWVVGPAGVVAIDRVSNTSRFLATGGELGAEPYDVVLSPEAAWIATRHGVVRLARRAGGLPR